MFAKSHARIKRRRLFTDPRLKDYSASFPDIRRRPSPEELRANVGILTLLR